MIDKRIPLDAYRLGRHDFEVEEGEYCPGCGDDFYEGDVVVQEPVGDRMVQVLHAECAARDGFSIIQPE